MGDWTVEVDFVNWYPSNSGNTPNYNPPVGGLLMGESYHIIAGANGAPGVSFTENAAVNPAYLGHSLVANHLGPYTQQLWKILSAPPGGTASAAFEVDSNGVTSNLNSNIVFQIAIIHLTPAPEADYLPPAPSFLRIHPL